MTNPIVLPPTYQPFAELRLCSNVLRDVVIPIAMERVPLLLVGHGQLPLVWLGAPVEQGVSPWSFVVSENRSTNPAVLVHIDPRKSTVRVTVSGQDVLIVFKVSDAIAEVTHLDLRPIGFDLVGTTTSLRVGGMQLVGNTLVSLEVGLSLTAPERGSRAPGA
jgi:hypothetical protein